MTTNTLGQVLYEAQTANVCSVVRQWHELTASRKSIYERDAQAVAAVVREQCAQACEAQRIRVIKTQEQEWFNSGVSYSMKAIRSMKP